MAHPTKEGGHQESHAVSLTIGLVLALVLTFASFGLVWGGIAEGVQGFLILTILAVIQIGVHLRWFLHVGGPGSKKDINLAVAFAGVLLLIMVAGTVWIMHDSDMRMMTGMMG